MCSQSAAGCVLSITRPISRMDFLRIIRFGLGGSLSSHPSWQSQTGAEQPDGGGRNQRNKVMQICDRSVTIVSDTDGMKSTCHIEIDCLKIIGCA